MRIISLVRLASRLAVRSLQWALKISNGNNAVASVSRKRNAVLCVKDAQALVSQHFGWLTRSENIHTLAVDWKKVRGEVTDRPALVFYVSKKKHVEKLNQKEKIPGQVKDDARKCMIDTDVIEMKSFKLKRAAGGSEIAVKLQGKMCYGTLGVNIEYAPGSGALPSRKLRLLTSAHLVDYDQSTEGKTIINQRTPTGGLAPLFKITGMFRVWKYTQLSPNEPIQRNQKDVLWADVTDKSKISKAIRPIPPGRTPDAIREGVYGDVFSLSCASGFYQNLTVLNTALATRIEHKSLDGTKHYTFWENLMSFTDRTQEGDSGAAMLADDNKVIGLLMGGNGDKAIGCQLI